LDIDLFNQTAKFWTDNFAKEGGDEEEVKDETPDDKVTKL
jgi:hypothetical protein